MRSVISILSLLLVVLCGASAFVAPSAVARYNAVAPPLSAPSTSSGAPASTSTSLYAAKQPKEKKEGPSRELILRW